MPAPVSAEAGKPPLARAPQTRRRSLLDLMARGLRRQLRLLKHAIRPPAVRFVYEPDYERAMPGGVPFDPLRADRILAFLSNERLLRREEIELPRPASLANILLAHTEPYLAALSRPETLTPILGAAISEDEVESVLELQRLMAGGTIQTSRLALAGSRIAVNLGGGFHHAEPDRGMGFCIFNDIVVAIKRLRKRGWTLPVLVVDLDLHDGNGTRAAFANDPTVYTFSIHNDHWGPTDAVASTSIALGPDVTDELYLGTLLKELPPVMTAFQPRLVFYLAGCDVAADDRLGNWRISGRAILARDQFVTEQVRRDGLPMAIVLGGGYGDAAWQYTARYLGWLVAGTVVEPPDNDQLTLLRFRQIKARLDPLRLTQTGAGSSWELTEEDLVGILPGIPHQTRFLGYFSKVGIELILQRFGILEQLRARGFRQPTLQFDLDHPLGQTLRIFAEPDRRELLVELRVGRSTRAVPGMEVMLIEWLLLQNPREPFTPTRRALPGQSHPGLGMLREFFGLLVILAEELNLDGLLFNPAGYHVAALSSRFISFVDPDHEAVFRAIGKALANLPLDVASQAVADGRIYDERRGTSVSWEPMPMVLPVSDRLRDLVSGEAYESRVKDTLAGLDFRLADQPATG